MYEYETIETKRTIKEHPWNGYLFYVGRDLSFYRIVSVFFNENIYQKALDIALASDITKCPSHPCLSIDGKSPCTTCESDKEAVSCQENDEAKQVIKQRCIAKGLACLNIKCEDKLKNYSFDDEYVHVPWDRLKKPANESCQPCRDGQWCFRLMRIHCGWTPLTKDNLGDVFWNGIYPIQNKQCSNREVYFIKPSDCLPALPLKILKIETAKVFVRKTRSFVLRFAAKSRKLTFIRPVETVFQQEQKSNGLMAAKN